MEQNFTELAAEIVGAYVAHTSVPPAELPNLLRAVHDMLASLGKPVPVAYGSSLASLGHCRLCHTPNGPDGKRDYAHRLGARGFSVETANGIRISANITSDPKTGIGSWSDAQIKAALTHGVAADGSPLAPIMPWPYLEGMKPGDVAALVAWLRTLPPIENAVAQ